MTTEELSAKLEAALVQLRAVEAERDALTKMAREAIPDYPFDPTHPLPLREAVYGLIQGYEGVSLACDDLRAELERKDAALTKAREERVEAAKRLSKQAARWLDDFIADSELIDAINGELAAALERMKP